MGIISLLASLVTSLFGGAPKAKTSKATADTTAADRTSKAARVALYETAGGQAGMELTPAQVKKRDTLFGN